VIAVVALAITATTARAATAAPSTSELTKQIDALSNQLEDITESYNKLTIQLQKTVSDKQALTASLGPAKDALKVAQAQMQAIAAKEYMTGHTSAAQMLLDSSGDLLDRISVLDQMQRNRQRDIDNYLSTTQNYDQRQAALQVVQNKQNAQANQLAAAKKDIEGKIKVLLAKRTTAYGKPTDTGTHYTGTVPNVSGSAGVAVKFAFAHIGDPYKYAASGPHSFDCSGLTAAAWEAAGKSLPHNAAEQYSATARISRADLALGDLVFYRSLGHVAIYVGDNSIIDAPHTGTFVNKRTIDIMPPYGYGRVK
jgi:cell wall-associated NlpC family hydrolase